MQIIAYAIVDIGRSRIVNLINLKTESNIHANLQDLMKQLPSNEISQFQKMQNSKDNLLRAYGFTDLYQRDYNVQSSHADMLLDTIQNKIVSKILKSQLTSNTETLSPQQQSQITELLSSKNPNQTQRIISTLERTKQTIQENVEKIIVNKQELQSLEIKSSEMDGASRIFLNTASQIREKERRRQLIKRILIGGIVVSAIGITAYLLFG